jgi:hypothetical protein
MRNSPDGLAHRLDTFQLFSSYSTRSTHEATRKQGRCPPERVFAVVARAREGGLADARGTRDRLRPLSPLDKGFLTGAINENRTFDSKDFRNIVPRFTPEARKANQALVDPLGELAARRQATRAQIAIAWLLAQKPWIVPIPVTTKLHRLEENLGAATVELTPGDLSDIESAVSKIPVQADRYPAHLQQLVGCWTSRRSAHRSTERAPTGGAHNVVFPRRRTKLRTRSVSALTKW